MRAMREDVLETSKYPEITFRGTGIRATRLADNWFRLRIDGEIRLHGVTGRQEIDAQLRLTTANCGSAANSPCCSPPTRSSGSRPSAA